jgi:ubiquinone/menaquinone biosynthesis C-methylase UbiE
VTDVERSDHAAWNEHMARRYDPDLFHRHPSPLVRLVRARRVRAIHRLLRLRPHHHVLDLGCGAGNILAELDAKRRVGVDPSEFLLDKARQRLGERAELVRAPGEALPFADGTFDRVLCSEVLEHVPDPWGVVAEMRRVLKGSGIAVVTVPNEPLIDRVKAILLRTRLFGLVMARGRGGYQTPEKMQDEWHLHAFDEALLRAVVAGHFQVRRLHGLPLERLPLGFAAQLVPWAGQR